MKKFITSVCCLMLISVTVLNAQTEAEMQAWQTYMTPGDIHKMMAKGDGEWNEEITMWMDSATAPTKAVASSKAEMIMGGRYQVSKTTGDMMGMPFEGMQVTGFDNAKKLFTTTWIDNMGTGILTMEGPWDEKTSSINFKGKGIDPTTGKNIEMRQVIKFVDDNTQEIQMYDTKNGIERKTMEIKLTRKK